MLNLVDGKSAVIGFGESLTKVLNVQIDGLRSFPAMTGVGVENPFDRACAVGLAARGRPW